VQLTSTLSDYARLMPMLPTIWYLSRTRITRTIVRIIQTAASATWDWLMAVKAIPERIRRTMIADPARQVLESS
jgi:hypothetical protein